MPKRKTKESSDSNNKTSTEPARDVQQFIYLKKRILPYLRHSRKKNEAEVKDKKNNLAR
jgi:hypothetical protein